MKANMNINARLIVVGLALCCAAAQTQAQITFRAAGVQTVSTGTSISPAIPAGTQAGDLAVLIVAGRPADTTQPAAPAGWTLRSSSLYEVGSNDLKVMTFYHFLTGGDANPTVNLPPAWQGNSAGMSGQIAVWRGVNTTTPFDVADVTGNSAAVASWTPPTITTLTPGASVVSVVSTSDDNALAIGTAQGFTGRMTGANYNTTTGGDHSVGLADKAQATAGTPTMLTWGQTKNTSDRWAAITFALRPLPVNSPPTVSLTSPTNGASYSATMSSPALVTVSAVASDSDGSIASVTFIWNDFAAVSGSKTVYSAPYSTVVELPLDCGFAPGFGCTYELWAFATDNQGASTSSNTVTIHVAPNVAPSVALTSPSPNATFTAPANISLQAEASDSDGTISSVAFYHGSTLITTLNSAPYSFMWTGVPQGNYSLTAHATDNYGTVTISAPVNVTVNASVAKLHFIHTDHLNTPRLVADATGTTAWRWDQQEPFGVNVPDENPSSLGTFEFPLRLPGQYLDKETNLHYNYHRDYDPSIGRYVESDPIGLRAGINTYAYVSGDALTRTDPMGLKAQICCKKIPRWWIPAAHCFVNEVSDTNCCGSKTRRVGLQGPAPWGSSKHKDKGEVKPDDLFDNPKESQCGDWNTDCGVTGCIDAQVAKYPDPSDYNAMLGPNSNTFAGTIARACTLALPAVTWPPVGWPDGPAKSDW